MKGLAGPGRLQGLSHKGEGFRSYGIEDCQDGAESNEGQGAEDKNITDALNCSGGLLSSSGGITDALQKESEYPEC